MSRARYAPEFKADEVLLTSIRQSYEDSGGMYGSPRVLHDLKEAGVRCSVSG